MHSGVDGRVPWDHRVWSELRWATDLLPLAFASIKATVASMVGISDSSESHYCVKEGSFNPEIIKKEIMIDERYRFTREIQTPDAPDPDLLEDGASQSLGLRVPKSQLIATWCLRGYGPRPGDELPVLEPSIIDDYVTKYEPSFLETFSGKGILSSCISKHNVPTIAFDNQINPVYDILDDTVFEWLICLVLCGLVLGNHTAIPCRTLTRGRLPCLRNNQHLLNGVPWLNARERDLVREGNELMRRGFVILNLCCACFVPSSVENPANSMLWPHPVAVRWFQD
jgi:hypothetical protein